MNLYDNISSNKRKTFLLVSLFFIIIISLSYVIGIYSGDMYTGIGLAFFALIFSIILSMVNFYSGDKIILGISKAKLANKNDHARLINVVEGLSIAANVPVPKIYVIDDTAINAFATGRDPEHASITVTTGAIDRLNKVELEGVVAHELSHIKNYDIRLMLFVVVLVGIIVLISDIFLRNMLYRRSNSNSGPKIGGLPGMVFILIGVLLALLSPFIAELIKLAVSRRREFLADSNGALLTRYPKGLASALKKIRDDKDPLVDSANKATAHLYIENPLRNFKGRINSMFSTHPPIDERIKLLNEM